MWRERGEGRGREGSPRRGKREAESERIREWGGAGSPFYSAPDLPGCCQVTVGRGISGCCQVTVGVELRQNPNKGEVPRGVAVRDCLGYLNWCGKPHPLWAAPVPG